MTQFLFTYGTLAPASQGDVEAGGWSADAVRGRLYDLGPFPALFDADDPDAGWVEGFTRSTTPAELEGDLDTYEGVEEGLFVRLKVRSRLGREVWIYAFGGPRPQYARGPIERWEGRRRPSGLIRASPFPADPVDPIEETTHD